jgi:N-acyl-phosphatidylethanolamine-hydrolysing phospholipase D
MTATFEWLGGPTGILRYAKTTVLIDPMLGPRGPDAFVLPQHPSTGAPNAHISRYTATPHPALADLDLIILSHPHNDHFDATAKAILPKATPFVIPPSANDLVRSAGFVQPRAIDWGERVVFDLHGTHLEITAIEAHHAHDPLLDKKLGRGNGYVLTYDQRYRVYWTGDTVLTELSLSLAKTAGPFDVVLLHMGGVGGDGEVGLRSMTSEEAVELVRRLAPKIAIPIHHTSFSHYREPIEALVQRAAEASESGLFRFPTELSTIELP